MPRAAGEVILGAQEPRIVWAPPRVSSAAGDAIECARIASLILDPWQELSLDVMLGEREDGRWSAFETAIVTARQNGKNGILEALEMAAIFVWEERLVVHTAHEAGTANNALDRMEELLAGAPEFSKRVRKVARAHSSEGIYFKTGQVIRYRTRTKGGARGLTGDRVIVDEAQDAPETTLGTLIPMMAARSVTGNPQVNYAGTAVDQTLHEHGVWLSRLRARGMAGGDATLAYLEWSPAIEPREEGAPVTPDDVTDAMAADLEVVAQANPALGRRISAEHVASERRSMSRRTFAVERLSVGDWYQADDLAETVFDPDGWDALEDIDSSIVGAYEFGFDVSPSRSWAAIGVAGRRGDGLKHVEVVEWRRGTAWLEERVVELQGRHRRAEFRCSSASPAAAAVPGLKARGVRVRTTSVTEDVRACGRFFDEVVQGKLRHNGSSDLTDAVASVAKRSLGDAFAWSRSRSSSDITALWAVTLAGWGLDTRRRGRTVSW